MTRGPGPRPLGAPPLALVDVIYLVPWIVGILFVHEIAGLTTLLLVPVFVASWWQDWRSARAAATYFMGSLAGFDALTAANYAALADSWRRPVASGMFLSPQTFFHWTGVFVIYILWNLALMRSAEPRTRRVFLIFSLAETPLVIIGAALTAAAILHTAPERWLTVAGIAVLAAGHIALLVAWRVMSGQDET